MTMHDARQMRGQRLTASAQAFGLGEDATCDGGGTGINRARRIDLGLKGCDVSACGLIKQVPMHRGNRFA